MDESSLIEVFLGKNRSKKQSINFKNTAGKTNGGEESGLRVE